jgi:hypothetical protein
MPEAIFADPYKPRVVAQHEINFISLLIFYISSLSGPSMRNPTLNFSFTELISDITRVDWQDTKANKPYFDDTIR